MSIILELKGTIPSKKNAWRSNPRGRSYLPEQIQADIDALVIQAQNQRHLHPVEPLKGKKLYVGAVYYGSVVGKDVDNCYTTLLDVLQKAGIIENDNMVRENYSREVPRIFHKEEVRTLISISEMDLSTD